MKKFGLTFIIMLPIAFLLSLFVGIGFWSLVPALIISTYLANKILKRPLDEP